MLDFIAKYWLEFLFGIIATGIIMFFKSYFKLIKKEFEQQNKDFMTKIDEKIDEKFDSKLEKFDEKLSQLENKTQEINSNQENSIKNLEKGLLSVQGRQFKAECEKLLNGNHSITLVEYEQFESDYEAYKALGGNHYGDQLHQLVVKKFETNVIPKQLPQK